MNCLSIDDRKQILHALCEGMSMRATSRVFDRPMGTIARMVANVGDWAINFLDHSSPVMASRIQVDELWSFVGENDGRSAFKKADGGVCWIYLAVDQPTGLVICYHIGLRSKVDATKFFRKLDRALAKDSSGEFVVRPTIVSDGLRAYRDAAERVFGTRVDFAQYEKIYSDTDEKGEPTPRSKFAGANRKVYMGNPALEDISTWRVERENGWVRQANRRLTRKTNGFSKVLEFHERQLAIGIVYRNYCWVPRPKRSPLDDGKWIKRVPAAMESGLADHIWTPLDVLAASDEFIANRAKPPVVDLPANTLDSEKRYWVVHQPYHQKAMIHKAECSNCLGGHGRMKGESKRTIWTGFPTLEDATAHAAACEPDEHHECKKCLRGSEYNKLSRYGRRL